MILKMISMKNVKDMEKLDKLLFPNLVILTIKKFHCIYNFRNMGHIWLMMVQEKFILNLKEVTKQENAWKILVIGFTMEEKYLLHYTVKINGTEEF